MPDPLGSIFYEMWAHNKLVKPESFEVEGVGKDSIPLALDMSLIDAVPRFSDEQAFTMCRKMARSLGMMVGGSAGGNVHAAIELARGLEGPAVVIAVMPDSGVKYLSKIFNDEWMGEKGYKLECQARAPPPCVSPPRVLASRRPLPPPHTRASPRDRATGTSSASDHSVTRVSSKYPRADGDGAPPEEFVLLDCTRRSQLGVGLRNGAHGQLVLRALFLKTLCCTTPHTIWHDDDAPPGSVLLVGTCTIARTYNLDQTDPSDCHDDPIRSIHCVHIPPHHPF